MHDDDMPMARASGAAAPAGTVGAAAGQPVIDPEAIARLRELDPSGQQGVLRRVLCAYETSLARHLGDIANARDGADLDRLMRAVHTLKSSSAAVGAMAFSQRCADIEQAARDARAMPDATEIQALLAQGQVVLAAVGAMLTV
jgi:HPt (histidine-containing phosphotransfer) domain-containing protein